MPVELFREVPAQRRRDSTGLERVALAVAAVGIAVGLAVLAFAWRWS